jgi:exosome complex component RRP4
MYHPGRNSAKHVNALIIVDVQNCFITGNLALSKTPARQDGAKVIPVINDLIQKIPFHFIVYTQDWHPRNHISFYESLNSRRKYLKGDKNRIINILDEVTYAGPKVETKQILWPSHCIQGTEDAALHKDLYVPSTNNNVINLKKGTDPDIDSYSAFWDNNRVHKTELDKKLRERNVTHVFVAGLAMDYCVGGTALDASDLNYTVYVIEDATGIIAFNTAQRQRDNLKQRNIGIIQANEVKTLVSSASRIYWSVILIVFINLF